MSRKTEKTESFVGEKCGKLKPKAMGAKYFRMEMNVKNPFICHFDIKQQNE